jgi:hypothetical protein
LRAEVFELVEDTLDEVLVNTGEFHAVGGDPRGGPRTVGLRAGEHILGDKVALSVRVPAASAARGWPPARNPDGAAMSRKPRTRSGSGADADRFPRSMNPFGRS